MSPIVVHDKTFELFISSADIQSRVQALAEQISSDYQGKSPLFLGVLNGAFMFCADLLKGTSTSCEVSFIKLSSYQGMNSSGKVKSLIGLTEEIQGRDIVLVEDIVDSGLTMKNTIDYLEEFSPNSIEIATLLLKPDCLKCELSIRYVGFEIPEKFVVGYGLDYNGHGRNFKDIYQLRPDKV